MTTNNTTGSEMNTKFYQKPKFIGIAIFLIISFFVWLDGGFEEKPTTTATQTGEIIEEVVVNDDEIIEKIITPPSDINNPSPNLTDTKTEIEEKFIKNNSPLSIECRKGIIANYSDISVFGFSDETARFYGEKSAGVYWGLVTGFHNGKAYYCELSTTDGEKFEILEAKFK